MRLLVLLLMLTTALARRHPAPPTHKPTHKHLTGRPTGYPTTTPSGAPVADTPAPTASPWPLTLTPSVSPSAPTTPTTNTYEYLASLYYSMSAFDYAEAAQESGYYKRVDLANAKADKAYAKKLLAEANQPTTSRR